MFDIENLFSTDYLFSEVFGTARYLTYVFRKQGRPNLKQFGRMMKSHFKSLPYTDEFQWRLVSRDVNLTLTYLPIKEVTGLLKNRGFEVITMDGLHILSCINPVVAFRGILTQLDAKLGRRLHSIAGIQFVVARKV